jgi:glycosyltransferase involved in cell wall biosynthesis
MNKPLVSCITPTYGRAHLLPEMLWCWVNQTYKNKELIIVNDEANVVLYTNIPDVKIFNFNERFVGLGAKRNFCVDNTDPSAEFIFPFDDDDLFFPDHIESLVQGFDEEPDADITKNKRHFMAKDNCYEGIMEGTWPFFGASCFSAKAMRTYRFKENYVMGEDVSFIDMNGLKSHYISLRHPTFVYRAGMGIIHASGHRIEVENPEAQKNLYDRIGNSIIKNEVSVEKLIEPTLSPLTSTLYNDLINRRLWT